MIIIVGAGLVGAILAIRLSQLGIDVKILEKNSYQKPLNKDGRTIAVTLGSKKFLEKCGLWQDLELTSQPINEIRVFEQGSAWTLDYDHKDLGPDPMGYIIEHNCLLKAMHKKIKASKKIEVLDNCTLQSLSPGQVQTKEYGLLKAPLIIGADGRHSWVRHQVNIKSTAKEYGHKALVAHFIHEKPHKATAWEIFQPTGPFAILPMRDTSKGQPQSGIVWCDAKDAPWETMPTEELERKLLDIFPFYGKLTLNSQRWTFPLSALTVDKVIASRTALVGDAAHVLHPIAGQGVNLGWRDVEHLTEVIQEAQQVGGDIGSFVHLEDYARRRKFDHKSLYLFTDGLTRLYGVDNDFVSFLRQTGLAVVQRVPPLKKFFMKKAMGI